MTKMSEEKKSVSNRIFLVDKKPNILRNCSRIKNGKILGQLWLYSKHVSNEQPFHLYRASDFSNKTFPLDFFAMYPSLHILHYYKMQLIVKALEYTNWSQNIVQWLLLQFTSKSSISIYPYPPVYFPLSLLHCCFWFTNNERRNIPWKIK